MKSIVLNSNVDLEARIHLPSSARVGIVLAHSFRNTMDKSLIKEAEKQFGNIDYATLAFNFVGHGNSGGSLRDVSYQALEENVDDAVKRLKCEGFESIGIFATSIGTLAATLSQEEVEAQVFVNPSPLYDPQLLFNRYISDIRNQNVKLERDGYIVATSGSGRGGFEMGRDWIEDMRDKSGLTSDRYNEKVQKGVRTLIVQGSKDELSDPSKIADFTKGAKDSFYVCPGADHNFSSSEHRA